MRLHALLLLAAQASAIVALVARGIAHVHRWLLAYLAGSFLQGVMLYGEDPATVMYRDMWLAWIPVMMVLQVGMAAEAYRRSLEETPGASQLSHMLAWSVSMLVAAAAQIGQETTTAMGVLSRGNQAVAMVLSLSAVLVAGLFGLIRPRRRRNVVRHERILAVHFAAIALWLYALHSGGSQWAGRANAWCSIGVCVAWAALLNRDGERWPEYRPPGESVPEEGEEWRRLSP